MARAHGLGDLDRFMSAPRVRSDDSELAGLDLDARRPIRQADRMHPRVEELVRSLGLAPHPEGGYYRETFRSTAKVAPADGRPERNALTGIYTLLERGQYSAWHVVASDEIWTHLEGDPIRLWTFDPESGEVATLLLGPLVVEGAEPQRAVPAHLWQAAEPMGEFALGACYVGPGFDFADFRMLDADPGARRKLEEIDPDLLRFE